LKATYTTIVWADGNNTGLVVPEEVIAALGSSKRPPVVVSLAGYSYRSTVAVMGGVFMIPFSKANREAAGVKGGEQVEVTLELDQAPRTVTLPDDLAAALEAKPGARAAFEATAPSMRKEYVRQVETAKAAETRARRIAAIVEKLAAA
jgi:hypothetical protein